MVNHNPLAPLQQALTHLVQQDILLIAGTEAVKHFKESFQPNHQGFTDETLEHWPDISERRKQQKQTAGGAIKPILTDTSNLVDSIVFTVDKPNKEVVISTDVPYAQRHNEGLNGMPKRQFIGPSETLNRKIINKVDRQVRAILDRL